MTEKLNKLKELFVNQPSVPCTATKGMFQNERCVVVDLPNGETISYFVDKNQVFMDKDPEPGTQVKGHASVHIVSYEEDSVVIQFPERYMLNGSSRQKIPKEFLTFQEKNE